MLSYDGPHKMKLWATFGPRASGLTRVIYVMEKIHSICLLNEE